MKSNPNLNYYFFALLATFLTFASVSFAQSEVGHGGDVIWKDGRYVLLDLVESGLEKTAKADTKDQAKQCYWEGKPVIKSYCLWYDHFSHVEAKFGPEVFGAVLNAATHLPDYDGLAVLTAIELYDWNFIPFPLVDIRDVNTPADLKDYPLYQLANRRDHTITVNSLIWDQLDLVNKAALITHEALYSLVRPGQ